jgi:hypothetical protein
MTKKDWIGERAAALIDRLDDRGLTVEPSEAREIISQRVLQLTETMGISAITARDYVTDEAISDLADMLAGLLADESPGVDLMAEPSSVVLSQKLVGRAVAGLAEAILFYQQRDHGSSDTGDRIRELAEHLSLFGSLIAKSSVPPVRVPQALVIRIAARLDRAASHSDVPDDLAVAWRRDAIRLRGSL